MDTNTIPQASSSRDNSDADEIGQLYTALVRLTHHHLRTPKSLAQSQLLLDIWPELPRNFVEGGPLMTLLDRLAMKIRRGEYDVLDIMERNLVHLVYASSSDNGDGYCSSPALNPDRLSDSVFDSGGQRSDKTKRRGLDSSDRNNSMSSPKRICSQSLPGPSRGAASTAVGATARKSFKTNVKKPTARKTLRMSSNVGLRNTFPTPSTRPCIVRVSQPASTPAAMASVAPLQVLPPPSPPLQQVPPVVVAPAVPVVAAPVIAAPVVAAPVLPVLPVAVPPVQAAAPAMAPVVPQQPLRRSSRRRFPPMKFWEGERLRYVRDPVTGIQELVHFSTYFHEA